MRALLMCGGLSRKVTCGWEAPDVTPASDAYEVRENVKFGAIDLVDTLEGKAASAKS